MKNTLIQSLIEGLPVDWRKQRSALTCEPATITMGVMAAGAAAAQIQAQQQAQKTGKSVEESRRMEQENVINETRRRATDDYLNQTRMEQDQQSQEEAAVAQKSMDVSKQTQRSVSTSLASAAERGVAGRTVNDIAQDYEFMSNEETGRLKQNQAMANQQHQENLRGMGTQFSNRVADARPYVMQPQKPVDYFGPIFGAGQQTLGTYTQVKAMENRPK
jgi:hypothetical protein